MRTTGGVVKYARSTYSTTPSSLLLRGAAAHFQPHNEFFGSD
jgi:hypothetical protein